MVPLTGLSFGTRGLGFHSCYSVLFNGYMLYKDLGGKLCSEGKVWDRVYRTV